MKQRISLLFIVLFVSACAILEKKAVQRPAWIENPGKGVSASCTTHVRGRYYQEDLAISRARTQLAARYGVTVKMTQNTRETVVNDSANVVSIKNTEQKITHGKIVKAKVKAKWHDQVNDELWVWVVPTN